MRKILISLTLLWTALAGRAVTHRVSAELQAALDRAQNGDTIIVAAGKYEAHPQEFVEQTCGNCQEHRTEVHASRGFLVSGKQLRVLGDPAGGSVLVTNAGYGLLI